MAKIKKGIKKVSKSDKDKANFNHLIRKSCKAMIKKSIITIDDGFMSELFEKSSQIKSFIFDDTIANYSDDVKSSAIILVDSLTDYLSVVSSSNNINVVHNIRTKTIEQLNLSNYSDNIFEVFEVMFSLTTTNFDKLVNVALNQIVKDNMSANDNGMALFLINIQLYTTMISTYFYKYKNKKILRVDKSKGKLCLIYGMEPILTNDEVDCLVTGKKDKVKLSKYGFNVETFVFIGIIDKLSNEFTRDKFEFWDNERQLKGIFFEEGTIGRYFLRNEILDSMGNLLDEQLYNCVKNRKYGIPSSGLRFDFIEKDLGIDYIDIKENEKAFGFKLVFSKESLNKILIIDDESKMKWGMKSLLNKKINYSSMYDCAKRNYIGDLYLSFEFIKDEFEEESDLGTLMKSFRSPNVNLKFTFESDEMFENFYPILENAIFCLYIALCNPMIKQNIAKISTVSGVERNFGKRRTGEHEFRIAHLRKLPEGYEMSDDAKLNAIRSGFTYIPKGYTFVREKSLQNDSPKVIKI